MNCRLLTFSLLCRACLLHFRILVLWYHFSRVSSFFK
uniref:Uncharacterized protein n=1 Tax=Arundo donax TaxID=35708 RepID=A0A0A8YV28_ARUDO